MERRRFIGTGLAAAATLTRANAAAAQTPGVPWSDLQARLGERLRVIASPFEAARRAPSSPETAEFFRAARNPYFLGDNPALTQSFGWAGAWQSSPSGRVVEGHTADDVAAAIDFARRHRVRLAVKGGGHSYFGGSNAPESLLIWTRRMNAIAMTDAFVPQGLAQSPVPAVTIGAGAIWGDIYRDVVVRGGRYVQGGGCMTVGVAGLIQSGGFGSFSKKFGIAAASLLEAEIVAADGKVRIVNEARDPELFFALRGGGGGSFGVVTKLTLRTHDLPATFGAVFARIDAKSDTAYAELLERFVAFYADTLFNPVWGEQIVVRPGNALSISMVFQGIERDEAAALWRPFFDWVRARPADFALAGEPAILAVPARKFWDAAFLRTLPGIVLQDDQPGAPEDRIFWASNREESGQFLHAYRSAWLPAATLEQPRQADLARALFDASRHWNVSLHMNKGLAGAPDAVRAQAAQTAINPAVNTAFALAICGAAGPPAYPGIAGHEPDLARARANADKVAAAMQALETRVPSTGTYLAESDYFDANWRSGYWGGANAARLEAIKRHYDPDNLFRVHHGIGA
ncbi:FAD-linked oxidoreductase [Cylindrospermopsis raciborskii CENA303]|uniref:FAD-linked oxidoreductase n=1 Tax=Cylindrospermopsis raciborskii CENA303 TaxID=1170769 RepID=A0A1X4G9F4_9CYAN|nr:FAD-linked oxidoreductase [Cylindrospermopsis raciborskii CENA303]